MITALTKSKLGRLILIPVVIAVGAYSWFSYVDGTQNVQDKARLKGWWGWLSPAMEPQWALFGTTKDSRFHLLKNIGSEWCRSDPQRGYKALSFILVAAIVLAGGLAWVLL